MGGCWWRVVGCRALQSFTTLFGSLIGVRYWELAIEFYQVARKTRNFRI
jgi:hypothetical protein